VSAEELSKVSPDMQKNILGEKLCPLVTSLLDKTRKHLARKITGMLLEMDISEVLILLDSGARHLLVSQVETAERLLAEEADRAALDEEVAQAEMRCNAPAANTTDPSLSGASAASPSWALADSFRKHGAIGDLDGAEGVSQGLSLACAILAQATLEGKRLVDSRAWRIPFGWYALHAGSRPLPPEWAAALQACWPDAPPPEAFVGGGAIGGLIFIEDGVRTPEECGGDVWASGPMCHIISKVIVLRRCIPCAGCGGLWPLAKEVLDDILEQLPELSITYFDISRFSREPSGSQAEEVPTEEDGRSETKGRISC